MKERELQEKFSVQFKQLIQVDPTVTEEKTQIIRRPPLSKHLMTEERKISLLAGRDLLCIHYPVNHSISCTHIGNHSTQSYGTFIPRPVRYKH